jgi:hypothetical protein
VVPHPQGIRRASAGYADALTTFILSHHDAPTWWSARSAF